MFLSPVLQQQFIKNSGKEAFILQYLLLKILHKIILLNYFGERNCYFSVLCHKTRDLSLENNANTLKQMHYNNIIQTIFVSQPIDSENFLMASHIIYLYVSDQTICD